MRAVPLSLLVASLMVLLTPAQAQSPAPGEEPPLELKFSSFFRQPVGPQGLEIDETLRAADGRQVRLVGYMVAQEQPQAGRFLMTPRPVRMSEHADGDADDLPPATVTVLLADGQRDRLIPAQPGLIALTGRLSVGRQEGADGRVSWVRLQLAPQALAERQASAAAPHSH